MWRIEWGSNLRKIQNSIQFNIHLTDNHEELEYTAVHVCSKNELFNLVNEFKPHLLIIDSHGNFDTQEEGSYIWIGNDKLFGSDIIKNLPQIPLVIMSCCWGSPIYGNSNTIAQAFFENGSFSVLSTFLPISIDRGFLLYKRILHNLSYALNSSVHKNWASFISHNLRTSYFDDLLSEIFHKFGMDVLNEDGYLANRSHWQYLCLSKENRRRAYLEVNSFVLQCINQDIKQDVEIFLRLEQCLPEFLIYTHLGRGDLIRFHIN
ncbi:CHAT domain-containing protein [Altericista sp. CCNU0014]|uniref:CHAT domain-containing protein n=1 Tax=Altericista sp. CCNU0014 TaxID=3082949 RepID=UPI00384C69F7